MPRVLRPFLVSVLAATAVCPLLAQEGAVLYTDNCAPCHNIGEAGGVGPDLRDIGARKDRAWLMTFVLDPKGTTMPPPEGLSRHDVEEILEYIAARSKALGSASGPAAGLAPAPAPAPVFTPADVTRGDRLYAGRDRFAGGTAACLSCHDAGSPAGLGGGNVGPNLSALVTRFNGPVATSAWLSSPPTPVMRAIYRTSPLTPDEVHALTAFLADRAQQPAAARTAMSAMRFLALGVGGVMVLFLAVAVAGRGRLRPMRRGLIADAAGRHRSPASHVRGFRSGGQP